MGKIMDVLMLLFKNVSGFVLWATRIENLKWVRKNLEIVKLLFGKKENLKLFQRIEQVQSWIDLLCSKRDNDTVKRIKHLVNDNQKGFQGFEATIVADKHGPGNHGLSLGYKNDLVDVGITSDGTLRAGLHLK